jgi:hypothetical protein
MLHHLPETRHLCSELVRIFGGPSISLYGNLEEIGESSAVVLTETPLQRRSKVRISCGMNQLKGSVEACTHDEDLGYFVRIRFDRDSRWSPRWFTPKHLYALFRSVAA